MALQLNKDFFAASFTTKNLESETVDILHIVVVKGCRKNSYYFSGQSTKRGEGVAH